MRRDKGKRKLAEEPEEKEQVGGPGGRVGGDEISNKAARVEESASRIGESSKRTRRSHGASWASQPKDDQVAEQVDADRSRVDLNRASATMNGNGNAAADATRAKFRQIARSRAAHFAHFYGDEDENKVAEAVENLADAVANGQASAEGGAAQEDWPGPFATARQLVEGRAAAVAAREESIRAIPGKPKLLVKWSPSRPKHFKKTRIPASLQDMSIEVLCANIEEVPSFNGIPEDMRKSINARLCTRRGMTPSALQLSFVCVPGAEVVIPDCTLVTEEVFTESIAQCATKNLEVLELGMCGRGFTDQLCATTLAPSTDSMPSLRMLTLTGAYQLTEKGLATMLRAAPGLVRLNLTECNMISDEGVQTVAEFVGSTLEALSLDFCDNLHALKILPSLVKMTVLQKLSLSGLSSMTDAVVREIAVEMGPNLQELSIAECKSLTDAAVEAVALCCSSLKFLDLGHIPLLTDKAIGSLAVGCRNLRTLRLNRGKFCDTALAAYVTASGGCLNELSLNSVRHAGDLTLTALATHSKGSLELLDVSFNRTISDEGLGLLADSCSLLREIRLFGCTQVTDRFLDGHSNPDVKIVGVSQPDT